MRLRVGAGLVASRPCGSPRRVWRGVALGVGWVRRRLYQGAASFPDPTRYGVMSARLRWIRIRSCDDTGMSSSSTSDLAVVYDGAVTPAELERWESELEGLFARLRPLFYRTESKKHCLLYTSDAADE